VALWRLPRPDFHRLVDTDFQDTPLTLWPARSPSRLATLYIESSDSFVASAAVSIVTGWNEPVPGRELHPLKSSAFSRRTLSPTSYFEDGGYAPHAPYARDMWSTRKTGPEAAFFLRPRSATRMPGLSSLGASSNS